MAVFCTQSVLEEIFYAHILPVAKVYDSNLKLGWQGLIAERYPSFDFGESSHKLALQGIDGSPSKAPFYRSVDIPLLGLREADHPDKITILIYEKLLQVVDKAALDIFEYE